MGCDIHLFTEIKRKGTGWKNSDHWQYNHFFDPEEQDGEREMDVVPIYKSRDYVLFGILAGVRVEENEIIDLPRGLPQDICAITSKEAIRWMPSAHSHSWLTLGELKDHYERFPYVRIRGMISPKSAANLDSKGETPQSSAGWTSPELGWIQREWQEDSPLARLIERLDTRCRQEFWMGSHPNWMERHKNDDCIRIVFWFDN